MPAMWDDRVKPSRRGYIARSKKPLKRSWIKKKSKRDRTFKDGRVSLANKSELRRQTYELAEGRCQHIVDGIVCGKFAPLEGPWWLRGELAHKKHGQGFRDDRLGESYWACHACHSGYHDSNRGTIPEINRIEWNAQSELWECHGCGLKWLLNAISRCICRKD